MKNNRHFASKPPMGWNSFDCYGIFANERVLLENLAAFEKKLKPHGYEYFVLDAGWYSHFPIPQGHEFPVIKKSVDNEIDKWGRVIPNPRLFPGGLDKIIRLAHSKGIKFGIHIMRGIPRKAVELDTPVKGTNFTARDIADIYDICPWNEVMYGVDMSKKGSQEYYNSMIALLAKMEIDFIKADDIAYFPAEAEAVAKAIRHSGRSMLLSLSPGNFVSRLNLASYRMADMVRITGDVWDDRKDLDKCFERWEMWQDCRKKGFFIDLDMIPFGNLQVYAMESGSEGDEALLAGRGFRRKCQLTGSQKRTFITMRALAASPLFFGGDLVSSDEADISMAVHPEIIKCNQNAITGKQIYYQCYTDIRKTPEKNHKNNGWIGIFNRHGNLARTFTYQAGDLGLAKGKYKTLYDIWNKRKIDFSDNRLTVKVPPDDVCFLRYGDITHI